MCRDLQNFQHRECWSLSKSTMTSQRTSLTLTTAATHSSSETISSTSSTLATRTTSVKRLLNWRLEEANSTSNKLTSPVLRLTNHCWSWSNNSKRRWAHTKLSRVNAPCSHWSSTVRRESELLFILRLNLWEPRLFQRWVMSPSKLPIRMHWDLPHWACLKRESDLIDQSQRLWLKP